VGAGVSGAAAGASTGTGYQRSQIEAEIDEWLSDEAMLVHTSGTIGLGRTYADFIEHVAPGVARPRAGAARVPAGYAATDLPRRTPGRFPPS
jgi:hypothetical protein